MDYYPHAVCCLLQVFRSPLARDQEEAKDWGPLVGNLPFVAGKVGLAASATVHQRGILQRKVIDPVSDFARQVKEVDRAACHGVKLNDLRGSGCDI